MHVCVCLSLGFYLSICPSVCLSVSLSVRHPVIPLSVCLFIFLSVLFISLSVHPSVCISISLFFSLFFFFFVYPSSHLSISRNEVLRTQKLRSPLLITQSWQSLLKSFRSRWESSHACFAHCQEFLSCPNFYLPGSFTFIFGEHCTHNNNSINSPGIGGGGVGSAWKKKKKNRFRNFRHTSIPYHRFGLTVYLAME